MKKASKNEQVGIMSVVHEGRRPFGKQTYFFEDMVRHAEIDEDQLFFFSPLNWDEGKEEISGFKFIGENWVEEYGPLPKVIYDRAFSKDPDQKENIEKFRLHLENSDVSILNPLRLADLLNNKVAFHTFLQQHDIATLKGHSFSVLIDDQFLEKAENSRYYIKPTFGSKGEGIFVIEKKENTYWLSDNENSSSFESYTNMIDALREMIEDEEMYFVQEEAKTELLETAPFDIRVLVQNYGDNYEVTGKAVRIGKAFSITSNLNSGGSARSLEELVDGWEERYMYSIEKLHLDIDKLCLECSEVLKDEFGDFCEIGYDILVTKDRGPIIIEGNAKPSRWVFVKIADHLESIGKDNSYFLDRRKETVSVPMHYAKHLLSNI